MKIAFFGSSLVSAYWNGAATYYRGLIRAMHARGHQITFYEPDAYGRQQHKDIEPPPWAKVVVYRNSEDAALQQVECARGSDLVVKASGVGVFDQLLEAAVLELKSPTTQVAFWDVDAPATLDRVHQNSDDPFLRLIPQYDFVFTYGGGPPVVQAYQQLGAKACVPIYNGLDPETHFPEKNPQFAADFGFLGNRLPDREARVEEFFLKPARSLPLRHFLLGGNGWEDKPIPANVDYLGHVYTSDHNAFNASPLAVLNVCRESMARYGYSPATRVFEAAGASACIITDAWAGIDAFFEPGCEILVAQDGDEVTDILTKLTPERAMAIGEAAFERALAEHTYRNRAEEWEAALDGSLVIK